MLDAWGGGDEAAGATLVARHFRRVFRFFRGKVVSDAEDLTQRCFMACVEQRERMPNEARFRAYLMGICYKQLLMFLRSKGRHDRKHEDFSRMSIEEMTRSPSRVVAAREEQRLLLTALRRIPVELQVVIELLYWEEMTVVEIGEALGIPSGTVKSRLHRARGLLRARIEEAAESLAVAASTIDNLERWARELREMLPEKA